LKELIWLPDLIFAGGGFQREVALIANAFGKIEALSSGNIHQEPTRLTGRALLPGLINAHSHSFQRVIRARTEYRTANSQDSFWTWREMMYSAATRLDDQDIYDASRMAFMEMAVSGITTVGEFHYLHHAPDGTSYADPNLLAKIVIQAARDVGLRIALLRVAYARSGFELPTNPLQARFIEADPETFLKNYENLAAEVGTEVTAWTGIAPHSVRAVPLDYLQEIIAFGNERGVPIHMHLAEQPAELAACVAEHRRSPVALLESEGLLSERFTAVHAIHLTEEEVQSLATARAMVCACPTTERNLGDGVVPADIFLRQGVGVSLGTDSQIQIDLLEEARELEYHLRLEKLERAVLTSPLDEDRSALAARLFDCATVRGAESISAPTGHLNSGGLADFFTVDLDDPSICGAAADDLLSAIVFSLSRSAIKDVVVGGKQIVREGKHFDQDEIVRRFKTLQNKLWG
jgi:formimidoylglutamate deiminase